MKLNIARASALGTIGIGIMSLALTGGCAAGGGDPTPSSPEQIGQSSQPVITPVSLTTNGCNAVGTFGFNSPQIISIIAANTSAFQNSQLQLFIQTSKGSLQQLNTTAQSATAAQMAMFSASSASKASQQAQLSQTTDNQSANSAATASSATARNETQISGSQTAFSDSDTTVFHHDESNANASGTAANSAWNSNSAMNAASGNNGSTNSATQNFLASASQTVPVAGFFGGIAIIPVTSSSNSNQLNSTNAVVNAFFSNAAAAQSQAAAAQNSSFSNASHTDNTTLDKTDTDTKSGSSFSQDLVNSLSASNATSAMNAASNSTDLEAQSSNKASQSASNSSLQNNTSSSSSTTQVFNDLETFNSNSFVLVANLTATQANTMLQLFQGSNGVVTGNQSFPIVLPSCN